MRALERHSWIHRVLESPRFGDAESERLFLGERRRRIWRSSAGGFVALALALLWLSVRVLVAAAAHAIYSAAGIWVIVILMGGCLWGVRRAGSYAGERAGAVALFSLSGIGIVVAVHGLGGIASPAYVWILLWMLAIAAFTIFSLAEGVVIFGSVLAGCAVSATLTWVRLADQALIANLVSMLGAILIALLALRRRQWQSYEEFRSRRERDAVQDELAQIEDTLDAYSVRLMRSERLAMVGKLAAGVSHEFNNLLTAISGRAELAGMGGGPADLEKSLRIILESTRRGTQIATGLLSFARPSADLWTLLDANDLVGETLSLFRKQFSYEDTQVEADLAVALPPVRVNRNQMQRVLATLYLDAQGRMERGGRLLVATRLATGMADTVEIVISDEGAIPSNLATLAGGALLPEEPPVGQMSLRLARGLVLSHGGDLCVDHAAGADHTTILRLPAATWQTSTPSEGVRFLLDVSPDDSPGRASASICLDVWIAHSDASVREALAGLLGERGHRVVVRERLAPFIARFGEAHVDLIVLGPDSDSEEVRRLHRHIRRCGQPVCRIMMLDSELPDAIEEAISLGAWAALPAPVAASVLLRVVHRVEEELLAGRR